MNIMGVNAFSKKRVRNFTWSNASDSVNKKVRRAWQKSDQSLTLSEFRSQYKQELNNQIKVNRQRKLNMSINRVSKKWVSDIGTVEGETRNISSGLKMMTARDSNVQWQKNSNGVRVTYSMSEKEYKKAQSKLYRLYNKNADDLSRKQITRIFGSKFLKETGISLKGNTGSTMLSELSKATDSTEFYQDNRDLITAYNEQGKKRYGSDEGKALSIIYNEQVSQTQILDFQNRLAFYGGDFDKLMDNDEDIANDLFNSAKENKMLEEDFIRKAGFGI